MILNLRRLTLAFIGAFAVTALALAYWGIVRSESLLARDDNPRRVEAELAIQRGGIVDRHGTELALSALNEDGDLERIYSYPGVGPVVGYYSLRYGVGGVEAAYDDVLRGDAFLTPIGVRTNRWLHRDQTGGDVRLTIDLPIQMAAGAALDGERGALVIVDVPSGEILALASSPTYEPNLLDEQWEALLEDESAPLVNRVTQGLYPPGTSLQTVLLGAALNTGVVELNQPVETDELAMQMNGETLDCGLTPGGTIRTLLDAYLWACPAPFEGVGEVLGRERLDGALTDFGLGLDPALGLRPELVADTQPPVEATLAELAMGQGDLAVTPLQMALVAAAVANHGEAPPLRLVDAVRSPGGDWEAVETEGHPRAAISRDSTEVLSDAMREAVRSGAANDAALTDAPVSGHAGLSVSGETRNAWFVGFVPKGEDGWLAIAVLVEDAEDAGDAARVGRGALGAALHNSD
jgi:peptidoglycan glycosyltransferase